MKELICTFIFALVVSCVMNSFADGPPPFPWPVGVSNVGKTDLGMKKRDEGNIGEMEYVNGARPVQIITEVNDQTDNRMADFPLGANN